MGSLHVIDQLLFSMFSSIVTLDFHLILGSFLTFLGPNGLILESGYDSKALFVSTYVVDKLKFSMIPSILTFEFDLIFRSFLTFWSDNGLF